MSLVIALWPVGCHCDCTLTSRMSLWLLFDQWDVTVIALWPAGCHWGCTPTSGMSLVIALWTVGYHCECTLTSGMSLWLPWSSARSVHPPFVGWPTVCPHSVLTLHGRQQLLILLFLKTVMHYTDTVRHTYTDTVHHTYTDTVTHILIQSVTHILIQTCTDTVLHTYTVCHTYADPVRCTNTVTHILIQSNAVVMILKTVMHKVLYFSFWKRSVTYTVKCCSYHPENSQSHIQ